MANIVIRGDDELWDIPLVSPGNGSPIDLSGHAVWVTVKTGTDVEDEQAVYQHYINVAMDGTVIAASGMSIKDDDPTLGVVVQHLTAAESALINEGAYTYDVQVMLPNGRIKTPILGDAEQVVPDWTRAITPPEAP